MGTAARELLEIYPCARRRANSVVLYIPVDYIPFLRPALPGGDGRKGKWAR